MTAKIIDGKEIARLVRADWKVRVEQLRKVGVQPGLAVIMVGENAASKVYVRNKVKACQDIGIHSEEILLPTNASQEKVLAICHAVGANTYVNAIGGRELYSAEGFRAKHVDLKFIQSKPFEYAQFGAAFVPWLSIIDVMKFNPHATIQACLNTNAELI